MTYFKQKPGSIEEVIAKQQSQYQDPNYKAKFDEALKDSIRGIGSMTPKEKTEFFNKLDAVKKEDAKKVQKKNVDTKREQKEEWKPSNGKHADESLMKDFIDKGGKVEKIPEGKTAYIGNKIKPHLANERNLERQKQMTEETISERGGANTSSRQGSFAKSRKPKYRFGYRVAEKQPKGNDIEEAFSQQLIKQAYGILNDPRYKGGNYSGAVEAIEKLAKGLSKHPDVANALKRANESVEHDSAFAISGVETQRPTEDLQEGKWSVEGITGYKDVSGQDRFKMIISATSKQDAERKWEKELDKHRAKRNIGPRGGGSIEDPDDIDIEPAGPKDNVGDISAHITQEYVPEAKAPFRLSYDDKYGKHAGFEDAKTLQDLQNKAQKLRAKGFKINKMGRNTSPVEEKLPEPEGKTEVPEAFAVQVTKMDGGKFIHGSYKTKAEAEKWIKWYKTGDVRQTKKIEVVKEDTGYLQSKMSPTQIANIKNVWKNKKASDVTTAVKAMIKRMDIPTQLAIKQADIPHISKLVEDDDKAYAIGMAKAKEIKKDHGTPLKKSTVEKGHEIAKAIKKDEQVVGVGPRATFERLWLKHKRGDKAKR